MEQSMAEAGLDMAACLERVRQRDEEAARSLVRDIYSLVMKIVRSHLPRRIDEEDLSQTVFAKVFAHVDQYSGNVPFEHWVSRVAVIFFFSSRRRHTRFDCDWSSDVCSSD